MTRTYQLRILGRDGMYTYGEKAATPEIARIARGNLYRGTGERLCIVETVRDGSTWIDVLGSIVVDVEPEPGAWD